MTKKIIKKIGQIGGLDIRRYNKSIDKYKSLYKKYQDFTMIPEDLFVLNLDLFSKYLHLNGDVVECGVWRGGMIAAMAEMAMVDTKFHLFDSFEGLPPAKEIDGVSALKWQQDIHSPNYHNNCTADEEFAIRAMERSGSKTYQIYKGWFLDVLKDYNGGEISVLRLDGDWYDSIYPCMSFLFPKLMEGGIVILDDYYVWDGCAKAIHDYLSEVKSTSRLYQLNNQLAYIVKKS